MTCTQVLDFVMWGFFILLAALSLADYIRVRDRARLDIHLMFASLSVIMWAQLARGVIGLSHAWLSTAAILFLLAQPHLLLRLTAYHRPVPPVVNTLSAAGLIVSGVAVLFAPSPMPGSVQLFLLGYFVTVEAYAAWTLARGSLQTEGHTRRRLQLAALGSGFLAFALFVGIARVAVTDPALSEQMRIALPLLAIVAALFYYLGFATPHWLRNTWQLAELHRYLQDVSERSARAHTDEVLQYLTAAAVRVTGGVAAMVALRTDQPGRLQIRAASGDGQTAGSIDASDGDLARAWIGGVPVVSTVLPGADTEEARLASELKAAAFMAVPIARGERAWGLLIVFLHRRPLFADDDSHLLSLFAEQAAIAMGYSEALEEQEHLVEELRRSNAEFARATQMKSEFLANMSHELRTPLNAIIGFAELMHDEKVGPVSEMHKEFLDDILTSSRHLLRLINDVLDLSKVEAGKMEFFPESVDPGHLVREVTEILRALSATRRIRVSVEVDGSLGQVLIDPAKFKQVLYNYLSNAIKFTPEEGEVTVRVVAEGEQEFRVEVIDTGIGVSADDIHRLFSEFQQLDTGTSKRYQGTGLGLALTRRIVEAQGGRVGVESQVGEGSRFFAVLPRQAQTEEVQAVPPAVAPSGAAAGPAVLVVEDEPKDREWLVRTLTDAGYTVDIATTGEEAVAKCRDRAYDAITLDLMLPDMSGLEVLRAIRSGELNGEVPVVVATVVAEKGVMGGFRIHDYLTKPLQADTLLASLQRAGVVPHASQKILVVDDDRVSLRLMERSLKQIGYLAVCKSSGPEGLEAVARDRPAAVILDLMMPEMDGFEFLEKLRGSPYGADLPVLIWTARELDSADIERLRSSAQGVVLKRNARVSDLLLELSGLLQASEPGPEGRSRKS